MADTDAQIAESSPAEPSVEVTGLPDIEKFTAEERREWSLKGTPLKPPSPTAASTPATKPAPKETTAETAVDSGATSTQGKPKGADARVQELLAERHELRTRLEALEKANKPAESPAAPETKPEAKGKPVKPDFATYTEDGKSYADYKADLEKYEVDHESWLIAEATRTAETRYSERQAKEAVEREWAKAEEAHPGFGAARQRIAEKTPALMQMAISEMENWAAVIAHLGKEENDAEFQALVTQFDSKPVSATIALGKLAEKLATPPEKEAPVTAKTTKAPRPITDISGRNAAPVDLVKAALERDDFEEYKRLMNEKDLAARRKRA